MAENTRNNCSVPDWYNYSLETLDNIAYNVMPLVYLISTIIPSFFVAVGFCIKYRRVSAYIQQKIYICHLVLYGVAAMIYVYFNRKWGGRRSAEIQTNTVNWFRSSFALMWYSCHLTGPMLNAVNIVLMTLLVWMAVDRLLALAFPVVYRKMSQRMFAFCMTAVSYTVGISVNISETPRFNVVSNGDVYSCVDNRQYVSQPVAKILSSFRNSVNVLIVVCILILDTVTIVLFFKRRKTALGHSQMNARERENKRIARALLVLTVSQSVILMLGQPFVIAAYVISYFYLDVLACYGSLITVFLEMFTQILRILQFIGLFAFSRPYTDLLIQSPFAKRVTAQMTSA